MNIRKLDSLTKEVIETLEGIVNADWRSWEELASPDEFVRWSKSRVSHTLALIAQYAYPDPVAPQPNHIPDIGNMGTPTDTEMLNWMISKSAAVEHYPFHPIDDKFLVVDPYDDVLTSGSNPREAIAKAMRGEE